MFLEMKILLIASISEAWVKTPKWVKSQTEMRKKSSEEKVREERRRERGFDFAVKRTSVGHHSLIQTPSARVGSPWANFLYPIFYIQFSVSNFL